MRFFLFLTTFLAISTTASYAQGSNGLVAHWPLNGNANDISGNGLNGTVNGSVTSATGFNGNPGTAMTFAAAGGGISVPYNSIMNLNNWSACTLVKFRGFHSGPCQVNPIIARGAVPGGSDFYWVGVLDNSYDAFNSLPPCTTFTPTQERVGVGTHSAINLTDAQWVATPVIDTGVWYCIVSTYANDTLRVYLNGALIISGRLPSNYAPSTAPIQIAYSGVVGGTGTGDGQVNGWIDDIRLYNRGLSIAEVDQYCDSVKMSPKKYCDTLIIHDTIYLTTGIPNIQQQQQKITVIPNPAQNYVNVIFADDNASGSAQLLDAVGRIIKEQSLYGQTITFDISSLPVGVYMIKTESNGQTITQKLLKN